MKLSIKKYILALGLAATLLPSCNDDFMERYPLDKITDESFWKSETDLKMMLNSLYPLYIIGHRSGWADSDINPLGVTGSPLMYGDVYSDNCVRAGNELSSLAGELIVPTEAKESTGWYWWNLRKVNFFLSHYDKAELSQEKKNAYAAEAYFFKAWDYYQKVLYFGDVPWLTKDLNVDSEELYAPRAPRAEVMDSVLMCINKAVDWLPEKANQETDRLNKDQANFLKARICLFEGTFRKYHTELNLQNTANTWLEEAVKACETLLGKYSLYKDGDDTYWKMFAAIDVSNNPEVILSRNYLESKVGHAAQRYYNQNNSNREAMGATRGLVDEYLCIDGRPIYTGGSEGNYEKNPNFLDYGKWTELENRDPRLTQTICKPGEYVTIYQGGVVDLEQNGITYPNLTYNASGAAMTGYRVIKHWMGDPEEENRTTNGIQAAIEFRYAELLLMYAEAKYELNGTLSQSDVDLTINALRERAGFDFEKYPTAKLTVGQEPADPRLDKIYADKLDYTVSPLLREIRRERRIELAIENHRYEDLMRWKAGKLLTVPLRGMNFLSVQDLYDGTHNTKPETAVAVELNKTVFVDENGFIICYPKSPYQNTIKGTLPWDDYRYYWPIPKEELIMNENFVQNQGWENK
ncbi:RagB/SusD family nutrient uptake outer membrane protein [Parabacteroides sp. TM07-1AC]|uniref:RagB/SusD family nutrient uptake outer membrane protein n=1 Tax=Parabacteroides sp. TM07-1AC TaxID=2292363 RepID=UPI000EFE1A3B|nr:RagB/SusD family nutrient uptake outer membrane protein [Parabacteroides sp. TM07-1AC]RHU27090.1 RagB/SusD family nutrient uptake outer membrane protein [Parabacteroides sp. TM07-1AC]